MLLRQRLVVLIVFKGRRATIKAHPATPLILIFIAACGGNENKNFCGDPLLHPNRYQPKTQVQDSIGEGGWPLLVTLSPFASLRVNSAKGLAR